MVLTAEEGRSAEMIEAEVQVLGLAGLWGPEPPRMLTRSLKGGGTCQQLSPGSPGPHVWKRDLSKCL